MKDVLPLLCACVVLMSMHVSCAQSGFSFRDDPAAKKIELNYNGKPVTAYCYFDSTAKPVLFPVRTLSGITVTRGYPISPRIGERTDHPHHVGLWFNYESVNGLDFWNNSSAIPSERKHLYGSIVHQRVLSKSAERKKATLSTLSHWVNQKGDVLLEETTTFMFTATVNDLVIDRKCRLKAMADTVVFRDVKDGLIAIRVARSLEMPSNQKDRFIAADGAETTERVENNEGVTGMYINREGTTGDAVWSSKSSWVQLYGNVQGKPVAVVIIDHLANPGYPTYWHARGYGLFAANPLGKAVFTEGREELNLTLGRDEHVEFFYRIIIHEGKKLTSAGIDQFMKEFHTSR